MTQEANQSQAEQNNETVESSEQTTPSSVEGPKTVPLATFLEMKKEHDTLKKADTERQAAELTATEQNLKKDTEIETLQKSLANEKIMRQVEGRLTEMGYPKKLHSAFNADGVDETNIESKLKKFDKDMVEYKTSGETPTAQPSAANILGGQPTITPTTPKPNTSRGGRAKRAWGDVIKNATPPK